MSCRPACPSQPASGVAIGGPSAASSRTPLPLTQAAGAPPSPLLTRLERLLLPALPLPRPPARPALCPWSPARDGGAAGAGAFSARDLDSDPAPGEVRRTGVRPSPSPPEPLYGSALRLSFPTLRSPLCALPGGPWLGVPSPWGRSLESPPGGSSWDRGAPPAPATGPSCLRHLFAITSPYPPALRPSHLRASALPSSSLIPNLKGIFYSAPPPHLGT